MSIIETYKITARTLSPVHIGSGEKVGKKEYWYNKKKGQVGILDMQAFYKGLTEKKLLDKFMNYMLFEKKQLLYQWINTEKITQKELEKWSKYILDARDAEIESNKNRDILLFCKNAYGMPYIPGSSIKGAIRTCLLTAQILEKLKKNPEEYGVEKDEITGSTRNKNKLELLEKGIEQKEFHTLVRRNETGDLENKGKATMDCMAGIRVSDSNPLDMKTLTLCKKIDLPRRGKGHELPIYRECITPNTVFTFEISIDTSVWTQNGNAIPYTIEDIKKSIDIMFSYYQSVFLDKFQEKNRYQAGTFCLGGGVGYPSKAVTYPILGGENWKIVSDILSNVTKKSRKADWESGIAPRVKKCTNYGGRTYDMGICRWDKTEKI